MKIMTILGTRPEIIRLSKIIPALDQHCDHIVVDTGQNFSASLKDLFYAQLDIRKPDYNLRIRERTAADQIGRIIAECDGVMGREMPDRILLLGDTNSALSAICAKRRNIPVFHMEAGNRCYDDRVPEEVNRRIIDHCSDVLLPYTENSRRNLLAEGIGAQRIIVTGNPINEVIQHYTPQIGRSNALADLGVEPRSFFLVTLHRSENVDVEARLREFLVALDLVANRYDLPVIVSTHPRTKSKMVEFGLNQDKKIVRFLEPMGFFDFVMLEKNAYCVLTDSGTVQEECCIFQSPVVTLRDTTERPETLECGSNILSGCDADAVLASIAVTVGSEVEWMPPAEYLRTNVTETVAKVLLGHFDRSGT